MKPLPRAFQGLERYGVEDVAYDRNGSRYIVRVKLVTGTILALSGESLAIIADDLSHSLAQLHADSRPVSDDMGPAIRAGKALGYRSWKLVGYELQSANRQYGGWRVGRPTRAVCKIRNHSAPQPDCQCGLYGLHSPEFASRWHGTDPQMVHGAVTGWGQLEAHEEGWRAQYAEPVLLAIDGRRQSYDHCKRIIAIGAEIGLPVVEWPEYETVAQTFADPVPLELRASWRQSAARIEHAGRSLEFSWSSLNNVQRSRRGRAVGHPNTYNWSTDDVRRLMGLDR